MNKINTRSQNRFLINTGVILMKCSKIEFKLGLVSIILSGIGFAYADQNIEIVGGNSAGNPKLAVINFANDDGSINDEITSDFKITGEFNVKNYISADSVESGNLYTISGSVVNDPATGQMQVTYQLMNNTTNKIMLNQTANFNKANQRKAIHTIDNNIYQKITNIPGNFTSKIAVSVKNGSRYSILIADYDSYNQQTLIAASHPITSLSWDKTGQYLSYVTYETGKPVVYVHNISKGTRYIVANFNGSNSSPDFTPNSQKLAVTLSKDYGSHIYIVNNQSYNAASSAMPLINFGTIDTEADISDNGKLIFTSDHDGGPQIFMSDLNGSNPMRITKNLGAYNTTARFSNDGSKITFINRNSGVLQTYVLDFITQSAYTVSQQANHDISPSFAPNNKLILFSSDDKLFISNVNGTTQTKLNKLNAGQIIDQRWARNF